MYRQFKFAALHWRFSSDAKPDSGGGSYFERSLFVTGLLLKVPRHDFFQSTITNAMSFRACSCVGSIFDLRWLGLWTLWSTVLNQRNLIPSAQRQFHERFLNLRRGKNTACNSVWDAVHEKGRSLLNLVSHHTSQEPFFFFRQTYDECLPHLSVGIVLLHCRWSLQGR